VVLTCLQCGAQRARRETSVVMNARVERDCEGRCGGATRHIAGLPKEHVHLTSIQPVSKHAKPQMHGARPAALPSF
jgi:hypothetical protein